MATNQELMNKLEESAKRSEDTANAQREVLVSEGEVDVTLSDGTITPNLNKRIKQYGGQVTSVAGKTGDVTINDISEKLELGSASKYNATDLPISTAQGVINSKNISVVDCIDDLIAIKNTKDGQTAYVKSYRGGWAVEYPYIGLKGGGTFIFNSAKVRFTDEFDRVVTNDKGRFINGWVRQVPDNEFTPEMFGAYGDAERLGQDDWQAIEDMFQSLMPCGTGTNMSWSEIGVAWNRGAQRVVRLDSLYKHTKTLFMPPNITIKQTNRQDPQSRKITQGFWYSPVDSARSTTCAVSNYIYSKVDPSIASLTDARWYLNKDIFYIPDAGDEGDKYYAFGWNIDLDQLTIITDEDVAVGLRFINVHAKTQGLSIGGYINGVSYQNPKIPRVGMLHFDSYVSTHDDTHIRADVQAIVTAGSNAGVVFNSPWLTQSNRKQKSSSYVPLYKTSKHTETGSIATTYIESEAHFNNPVYENWNIHVVAIDSPYVSIYRPHNESMVLKHEFYMINSSMNCELKSSFGHYTNTDSFTDYDGSVVSYPAYSAVYVKDCLDYCGIKFTGLVRYGTARLINGVNSGAVIELDYLITSSLTPNYGKIGKIEFVRKANWGEQGYKTLIINPLNGDDDNNGLTYVNPRKTLNGIHKLVDDFGIETVVQVGNLTLTKSEAMPKSKFTYIASNTSNLNFSTFTLNFSSEVNATFENLALKQDAGVNPLFRCESDASGSLVIKSNFSTAGGALLQSTSNCNIDILINNTSGQAGAYFYGTGSNNIIGVSSKGTLLSDKLVGGVNTKYIFEG